jgi:hypothetical protein
VPATTSTPRRGLAWLAAACLALAAGPGAAQQRGPIQLFPPPDQPPGEVAPLPTRPAPQPGDGLPRLPGPVATPPEATPEPPPGDFQVEGLAAPAIDGVGIEGQGFDAELWQESHSGLVLTLLETLPVQTDNPALRALTRRLLVSGGAPAENPQPGRLLQARIERLVEMGDLAAATALAERLPELTADSGLARSSAELALWDGDHERACQLAQAIGPGAATFWGQLAVFCRARADDVAGAGLALELLRDAGEVDDPAFFLLAESLIGGVPPATLPPLAQPSALHVALVREAGLQLPPAALAEPSPALLAATLRSPQLVPDERRLDLAEGAWRAGVLPAAELAARYRQLAPATDDDLLVRIGSDWGPAARAQLLRRIEGEPSQTVHAELLDAAWQAAQGWERLLVAEVFAGSFSDLAIDDDLLWVGPASARALLAAQRPVPAARWFSLLRARGGIDPEAGAAADALAPLFALAGVGGAERVPEPDLATLAAWRESMAGAADRAPLLVALLEAVRGPVPDDVWLGLLGDAAWPANGTPSSLWWGGLRRAEARARPGETVGFALHLLAGAPETVHPEAVIQSLGALRRTVPEAELRQIALTTALLADL